MMSKHCTALPKLFLLLVPMSALLPLRAQDKMPDSVDEVIQWQFSVAYEGCDAVIRMTALQSNGWHVYGQHQPEGAIAFPTEFTFTPSSAYTIVGDVREIGSEKHDTDGFPESYFPGDKAQFEQRIAIRSAADFTVELEYGFMACKTSCFPPVFRTASLPIKGRSENCSTAQRETAAPSPSSPPHAEQGIPSPPSDAVEADTSSLAGLCGGLLPIHQLEPVKINVAEAIRTDNNTFRLTVEMVIDSAFSLYAFRHPGRCASVFRLREHEAVVLGGEYTVSARETVEDTAKMYRRHLLIHQDIEVKDTSHLPTVYADLDLYINGCEQDFHNVQTTSLSFDLTAALDNGTRTGGDSLWFLFALSALGGLLALLTPCVFPMIPMTVSFFTKQTGAKRRGIQKAVLYALSIVFIYVLLGVLVASIAGEDALNAMATNPWVNLLFFAVFAVFALSFLGAFDITLPHSWVNRADRQADRGGVIGIFFMAFTLVLVSFSCTGPIVGSVLVQSAQGGLIGPIVAMSGFSIALALPFGLFAAFPKWLSSLPQSGAWLNTVKVVLGFIELAFALKFLSNADLVMQWHLLERELFLALWIGIFVVLVIYLLGKIQLPHDTPVEKLSVGRVAFACVVVGFIIYLLPGMGGAPLQLIAGFPPPLSYAESPPSTGTRGAAVDGDWPPSTHAYGHGINTVRDYDDALDYAQKVGKPLLVDFTGWACVNCRKMEEFVWADESISPLMANDFVVASLYVDDRTALPEKYKGEQKANGKPLTTIGEKWMKLQTERYREVTQPMYVILDHNENNISGKANYQSHGNVPDFKAWLENGKKQFDLSKRKTTITPTFEQLSSPSQAKP